MLSSSPKPCCTHTFAFSVWHMTLLASYHLCSFGVGTFFFFEITCPFKVSLTYVLFSCWHIAFLMPHYSDPVEGRIGAHLSCWIWGEQGFSRINVSEKLFELWVGIIINCMVWTYLTENYWKCILKMYCAEILQDYEDMVSVLTKHMG